MPGPGRRLLVHAPLLALMLAFGTTGCGDAARDAGDTHNAVNPPTAEAELDLDVPFVPTPHEIVASMLEMGSVNADDHLIDLGSGDGRIVIAAVRDRGARSAEGIDLDPQRVTEAIANAIEAGVSDRVSFEQGDLFDKDISAASVLTLYLTQDINLRLRPHILETLTPGSRVVSHVFHMGDWQPDREASMGSVNIYGWTIPVQAAGRWSAARADGTHLTLELEQTFQVVGGTLRLDDRELAIEQSRIQGSAVILQTKAHTFEARIEGERMYLTDQDGVTWHALREPH